MKKLFKRKEIADPILKQKVERMRKQRLVHVRYIIFMIAFVSVFFGGYSFQKEYNYQTNLYANTAQAEEIKVKKSYKKEYLEMKDWVLNEVAKAGFNVELADKIIDCESTWSASAIGDNGDSRGLWQIHRPSHKEVSEECALDYKCATYWAVQKRIKDGSWNAWSCARLVK